MARVRLSEWFRGELKQLASRSVQPAAEKAALDRAYEVAAPLVRAIVEAKYPPRDMKVCAKYGAARKDDRIRVTLANGSVEQFCFAKEAGPLVINSGSCSSRMFVADTDASAAIDAWSDATKALRVERDRRLGAYYALITTSRYLDEVTAVWPDAAALAPTGNLPVVALGPAEQALIAADLREREAA